MTTAVITFPGHFFQTAMCLGSLQRYHPELCHTITIIADDVDCAPWSSYLDDLNQYLSGYANISNLIPVSTLPLINDCVAGWWRQQLVKLTIDTLLPGDEYFVVDGDVIFRSNCDVRGRVPINRYHDPHARWSIMCDNYVKGILGSDHYRLMDAGSMVITSSIPFRWLDRELLQELRAYFRHRFDQDLVPCHMQWFQDQTIVADTDPPTRWVMSEWELIECFRRWVQGKHLPLQDIGAGYQLGHDQLVEGFQYGIYWHSYKRDSEIGQDWFAANGIDMNPILWQKSLDWSTHREPGRSR